jgi:glycosyltransferase involved in cell wall biosynthesis
MTLNNDFIVIVPFYNCKDKIELSLISIFTQDFDNLGIIIRDDCSTDGSDLIVKKMLGINLDNEKTKFMNKDVIFIRNKEKFYPVGNTYDSVINYVNNKNAIISVVDGDDMLTKKNAVTKINNIYIKNNNLWLVWSQHTTSSGNLGQSKALPKDEIIYNNRNYWSISHFRTCKINLFFYLNIDDLKDPFTNEKFSSFAGDAAFLYPFIEMCGNEHSFFLNESLYHYNDNLLSNEHNKNINDAIKYGLYYKNNAKRYKKIKNL